jgi:hypothetical protein
MELLGMPSILNPEVISATILSVLCVFAVKIINRKDAKNANFYDALLKNNLH